MSLSRKIVAAVDAVPQVETPPIPLEVDEGPDRLVLHLSASGPVGLAFDALEFTAGGRPEWPIEALRAWGDRLAARLTYLMESLAVIEVDADGGEVELRSRTPSARGGRRTYYEARLYRSGLLRLGRVAFDEATRARRPVPCQMTREMLERLADDLVASVS